MADEAKLRQVISDILDGADLRTITAKKVRQQAEEKLKLDLTDRKKEFDQLVMETLNEKQEKSEPEEESEEEEKPKKKTSSSKRRAAKASDSEDDDDEYKPESKSKKSKKAAADSDSDDDWKTKSKPKAKSGGAAKGGAKKSGGTGYTKTCKLSPELANVMGTESMARHEVVKQMWKIIKEKNLYDPKNKQFALCNEDLLPVFGVKRFRTFGMMKYLKNHFTD